MDQLISYIKAIHKQVSPVSIVGSSTSDERYMDGDIEVEVSENIFHFDNGVVMRYSTEKDNASSEAVCEECWITYDVIESAQQQISPLRKTFTNPCQESFWLKMQIAR